ncbi:MAG: hypothetical protein A2Y88_05210 [Chloroflexi bacterium RBG_13_48_10]|nr:MAG: hypothetical protein A2Y88_05210 [Chloroflexi bacterium RBG_13_48_10]
MLQGAMMEAKGINSIHSYHILFKEADDQLTNVWLGSLTFSPHVNGDAYIDISFTDHPVSSISHDQPSNHLIHSMFIDCIEKDDLS